MASVKTLAMNSTEAGREGTVRGGGGQEEGQLGQSAGCDINFMLLSARFALAEKVKTATSRRVKLGRE